MRNLSIAFLVVVGACSPSKQDWMDKFETVLVDKLCAKDFVYVHCFEIDEAGCRTLVQPITHTCIGKIADQLPDHMDKELGGKYGAIAGKCVGDEVGSRLAKKIRQPIDPKCEDASAWTH